MHTNLPTTHPKRFVVSIFLVDSDTENGDVMLYSPNHFFIEGTDLEDALRNEFRRQPDKYFDIDKEEDTEEDFLNWYKETNIEGNVPRIPNTGTTLHNTHGMFLYTIPIN